MPHPLDDPVRHQSATTKTTAWGWLEGLCEQRQRYPDLSFGHTYVNLTIYPGQDAASVGSAEEDFARDIDGLQGVLGYPELVGLVRNLAARLTMVPAESGSMPLLLPALLMGAVNPLTVAQRLQLPVAPRLSLSHHRS